MSNANILTAVNPVQPPRKRAYKIDDSTYIKRGTSQQIRWEVQAIDFVRQRTSIPVPSVIEMHIIENDTSPSSWFSMAMVPGCPLTEAWPNMDVEARQTTQMDLRSYLYEIQAVPPPTPAYIGSCSGGPAYDHRLNNGYPCGPFASESDFNDFLVGPVARCPGQDLVDYYRQQLADNHSIVFTHADLCGTI